MQSIPSYLTTPVSYLFSYCTSFATFDHTCHVYKKYARSRNVANINYSRENHLWRIPAYKSLSELMSSINFITEDLVQKLRIRHHSRTLSVKRIENSISKVGAKVSALVKSRAKFCVMMHLGWRIMYNIELALEKKPLKHE